MSIEIKGETIRKTKYEILFDSLEYGEIRIPREDI